MRKSKNNGNNKLTEDIIRAIYGHDINFVENWISNNDIDSIDKYGCTALTYAILANSEKIVKMLLMHKPDLNMKDKKGWYPLHYAAQNYLVKIAELLLNNGANIEVKDDYGNTPLWRATFASQGKGNMIKLLLNNGANRDNPNDSGVSPIKLANTIANYNVRQFFQ